MPFTQYLNNQLLDSLFGNIAYSAPATLYVGLSTSAPNPDGSGVSEPTGGGYSRIVVNNNKSNWTDAALGALSNEAQFNFPTASVSWGTISHVVIYDAPSSGNLLAYAALSAPVLVSAGDAPFFAAGDLDISAS